MKNGITINGIEYQLVRVREEDENDCINCDLRSKCEKNDLVYCYTHVFGDSNLRRQFKLINK